MTDRIVDSLTAMGFELRLQEGVGYLFDFGYYSFAYMLSDDNERLIRIVVTHLYSVNEENRLAVYQAMNVTSLTINCVKPIVIKDSVWMLYEHLQAGDCNLDETLEFIIRALLTASKTFHRTVIFNLSEDETQTKYKLLCELPTSHFSS